MKRISFAAAIKSAALVVSGIIVANLMASCSGPLDAGEDLEQIGVKAEKALVEVSDFSDVEANQVSNVTFRTSDGNTLKATVIGVTPRRVRLMPGAETAETRTINVVLEGTNNDGVTRTATTSYQQKKTAGEPLPPAEPVVIDIRLEADTTMMYQTNRSDNSNGAFMLVNPIRRITTWSTGEETVEELTKVDGLDILLTGTSTHSDFITNSPNVEECVFWNGLKVRNETTEVYNLRGFEVTETKQYILLDITAMSDANCECSVAPEMVLTTRSVKFTDPESGKSIEWKSSGEVKFASRTTLDEGREPLHEPEGDYQYKGTNKIVLDVIHNGNVNFANFIATTAIYNK